MLHLGHSWYLFICFAGIPKVTIQSSNRVPILSNAEIVATVQNNSDFPPTTSVKWQRYYNYSYNIDINITEDRYIGSTEDLYAPTLVINRVDFDSTHRSSYRCIASNAEGSWTSSYTNVYVYGSMYLIYVGSRLLCILVFYFTFSS